MLLYRILSWIRGIKKNNNKTPRSQIWPYCTVYIYLSFRGKKCSEKLIIVKDHIFWGKIGSVFVSDKRVWIRNSFICRKRFLPHYILEYLTVSPAAHQGNFRTHFYKNVHSMWFLKNAPPFTGNVHGFSLICSFWHVFLFLYFEEDRSLF